MTKISKKWLTISSIGILALGAIVTTSVVVANQNKHTTTSKSQNKQYYLTTNLSTSSIGDIAIMPIYVSSDNENTNLITGYNISINNPIQEYGTLNFFGVNGLDTIYAEVGSTIKISLNLNDSTMTVKDLIIYGDNQNVTLASALVESTENELVFEFSVPNPDDYLDGDNPFSSTNLIIQATYIKKTIGNNINWTYNGILNDINTYTITHLEGDTYWSELVNNKGWNDLFNNENTNNDEPINITIYLQGHNLILDEDIFVPHGYNLIFIGDQNDSINSNIIADNDSVHLLLNTWYDENNELINGGNITFYNSAFNQSQLKQVFGGWGLIGSNKTLSDLYEYAANNNIKR